MAWYDYMPAYARDAIDETQYQYQKNGIPGALAQGVRGLAGATIAQFAEPARSVWKAVERPVTTFGNVLFGNDTQQQQSSLNQPTSLDPTAVIHGPPVDRSGGASSRELNVPNFRSVWSAGSVARPDEVDNRFNQYRTDVGPADYSQDVMLGSNARPSINRARSDSDRTKAYSMLQEAQTLMASGSIKNKLRGMRMLKAAQVGAGMYGATAQTDLGAERLALGTEQANLDRNLQARVAADRQYRDYEARRLQALQYGQNAEDARADRGVRMYTADAGIQSRNADRALDAQSKWPETQMGMAQWGAYQQGLPQLRAFQNAMRPPTRSSSNRGLNPNEIYTDKNGRRVWGYQLVDRDEEE